MQIKELLKKSREIWGEEKLPLAQIIVRLGKVFGDICRWERNELKDQEIHTDEELKKEVTEKTTEKAENPKEESQE